MEHTGGVLMFTEVIFTVFGLLLILLGVLIGIKYENHRILARLKEIMEAENSIEKCCGNCWSYNGDYCTKNWNNADEDYCNPERDSREPEDEPCEDWKLDPLWSPEDDE